jgi:hypothetical protein
MAWMLPGGLNKKQQNDKDKIINCSRHRICWVYGM